MLIEKFLESENIRRFVFIPLIVSLFLFHTQLFQMLISWLSFQYALSSNRIEADLYISTRPFSALETLAQFLPAVLIGLVVGLCFAALDYRMHGQKDVDGSEGIRFLLRNLFSSGAFAWLAILIYVVTISVPIVLWTIDRRYYAYPLEMQLLEKLALLPPLFTFLALIWAMVKTLRRYKTRIEYAG